MLDVVFERNGTIREWYDNKQKYHKEEVIDTFIDGQKLRRGLCYRIIKEMVLLKPGESQSFCLSQYK
mgnify:CR=1 FL=1|jgi:hypothetical protein